jgi:hypothetical protein
MICSGRLICDKIWGGGDVLFVAEKNRGGRRNGGGGEEGRSSGHKLNIIHGFTDEFNR